jgi:hypothetical protein
LAAVLDAIREVTGMVLPPPGMPGPFALADRDGLVARFIEAGFVDVSVDAVPAPLRSPSFDAWWGRNLTVAGPVVGVLNGLDDATRNRVQDVTRRAVAPYASDGSLVLPGLANVLSGHRP